MNAAELQQELFQVIKSNIPDHLSTTEEIAKVLDVSVDSVYRRMRGEKTISLDELHLLCSHYKISLDQLMRIQTGSFLFQGNIQNEQNFRYEAWLGSILANQAYFNSFSERELYWLGKDIPLFPHFIFREIAAFKYFFWTKTLFNSPTLANATFNFKYYTDEMWEMGKKIIADNNRLPTVEIWNVENINMAIRQIEFYRDGHIFETESDALRLYEAWEKVIDHVERQAERGYKFAYGDAEMKPLAEYKVYFNEVILGDNSMLLVLNGVKLAIIVHSTNNYMMTRDLNFTENLHQHIQSIMRRSTLISTVSEKERSKFFRTLRERIARRKDALKVSASG
jgi:transcriptional regulator with XRE-family HTH domain